MSLNLCFIICKIKIPIIFLNSSLELNPYSLEGKRKLEKKNRLNFLIFPNTMMMNSATSATTTFSKGNSSKSSWIVRTFRRLMSLSRQPTKPIQPIPTHNFSSVEISTLIASFDAVRRDCDRVAVKTLEKFDFSFNFKVALIQKK